MYLAGVSTTEQNEYMTSGGRVLAVTGLGSDLASALDTAYRGINAITFQGRYFRKDIGVKGLAHAETA